MGVTTKSMDSKTYPPLEPKPTNKARLNMTYAEAVEDSRKYRENQEKVLAYKQALADGKDPSVEVRKQIVVEGPITTPDELPEDAKEAPKAKIPFVKKTKRVKKV